MNVVKTPVGVNSKLVKASEKCELVDQSLYQSAVTSFVCKVALSTIQATLDGHETNPRDYSLWTTLLETDTLMQIAGPVEAN